MASPKKRPFLRLTILFLFGWFLIFLMAIMAGVVHAQQQPPSMEELDAAVNRENDKSFGVLRSIFGQFAENPWLEVGTPDTLLGHVFLISNLVIMALGTVWFTYNVSAGILQTAHEGRVLGQRMSSVWFPIRSTIGIAGMLPVFGGFSAAQALMMVFTTLGIGAANMSLTASLDAAANYAPLVQSDSMANPLGSGVLATEVGDALFITKVCVLANRAYDKPDAYEASNLVTDNLDSTAGARGNSIFGERLCGGVRLTGAGLTETDNTRQNAGLQSLSSYRVNSVNYDAIAQAGRRAMVTQLRMLNAAMTPIALEWFAAYQKAKANGTPIPEWPTDRLEAARKLVKFAWHDIIAPLLPKQSAIREEVSGTIKREGWAVLGAWHSTFAEANAAIVDAANAYSVEVVSPGDRVGYSIGEIGDQLRGVGKRALSYIGLGSAPQTDVVRDALAAIAIKRQTAKAPSTCLFDSWQSDTGNCSMGQALALLLVDGMAGDSGGAGLVNPIAVSKNVGDWMMMLPQAIYAGEMLASAVPAGRAVSAAATATEKIAGNVSSSLMQKLMASVSGSAGGLLNKLATAMFVVGAVLAIYIPFVPFLTWMTGLVGYFAVVIEGLVAAQLMAFAHLSGEGEGMGSRTERGYQHLLNVLMRPTLMVVSFFIASAMLIMIGTLFNNMFGSALANVQGNSLTGFATILGILAVYMIWQVTMVQGIFNMIYEIPDRAIGWIGSGMEGRFGREMDNKIENLTHTAIRWSGGVNPVGRR